MAARSSRQQTSAMFSDGRDQLPEPRDVEVQVLVVEVVEQPLLRQILEQVEVHHVAGLGIDLTLDGELELVVVAVVVRIVAHAERLPVPGVGARRDCGGGARR